jgi:hypothetical protein
MLTDKIGTGCNNGLEQDEVRKISTRTRPWLNLPRICRLAVLIIVKSGFCSKEALEAWCGSPRRDRRRVKLMIIGSLSSFLYSDPLCEVYCSVAIAQLKNYLSHDWINDILARSSKPLSILSLTVRGALCELAVLLGVSAEPRLSQRECFDGSNWAGRSLDGLPADLECRDFTTR